MEKDEIIAIINSEPALFNARYRKDARLISLFINDHHGKTTPEEVAAAIEEQKIHPGTGRLME